MEKAKRREIISNLHRESILAAAQELFSQKGWEHTTMDEIAQQADCSKRTVYAYFESKEEIWQHIVRNGMRSMKKRFQTALKEKVDFHLQYQAVCGALVQFEEEQPLYFEGLLGFIQLPEAQGGEKPVVWEIFKTGEEICTLLDVVFQDGIRQGQLSEDIKIRPAVFSLWASLAGLVQLARSKQRYIALSMGMEREEFLQYGFAMLERSIRREKSE